MLSSTQTPRANRLPLRDAVLFAAFGAIMFVSYAIMQGLPNVHLIGVFVGAITLTYRGRALIPIYVYVLLSGVFAGFSFWWVPYLYIWLPLWLAFMLLGSLASKPRFPKKALVPLCMVFCALHGLSFGIMYAPAQALFFGLSFEGMLAWIAAGFVLDVIHAVSNFFLAAMIVPLSELLARLHAKNT